MRVWVGKVDPAHICFDSGIVDQSVSSAIELRNILEQSSDQEKDLLAFICSVIQC